MTTLVLFGFGMYGVSKIESEYDPVIYMDERSYQRRYFNALETYFPEAGERVEIYIGNLKHIIMYNPNHDIPKITIYYNYCMVLFIGRKY